MIAALYVETGGCYFGLDGVDPWDEKRDARLYSGPYSVVAHPPCQLWGNMAFVNHARWGGDHNKPGNDDGCFESALNSVRKYGGILEHPASSHAWKNYTLPRPRPGRWFSFKENEYVCEVWQSSYGHKARKRTWLFYCGETIPPEMNWERDNNAEYQIGGQDKRGKEKNKPTIRREQASATPILFRDVLISIARSARK